jgi:multiple sugar transport system permease protein
MFRLHSRRARVVVGLLILVLLVWVAVPYYFLVVLSLVQQGTLVEGLKPPASITYENYLSIFTGQNAIWPYLLNSTIVASGTTIVALAMAVPAGYGLSRLRTTSVAARWIYLAFFVLRMLPPVALVIPYFLFFSRLRLLDHREALIIALVPLTLPFTVWTIKVFFDVVSENIEEAAYIDGASIVQTFIWVVLPVVTQGIAATGLITFLLAYVDYMVAGTLARQTAMTLPVYLVSLQTDFVVYVGRMMAATLVGTLPMIVLYFYAQRYMRRMAIIGTH